MVRLVRNTEDLKMKASSLEDVGELRNLKERCEEMELEAKNRTERLRREADELDSLASKYRVVQDHARDRLLLARRLGVEGA